MVGNSVPKLPCIPDMLFNFPLKFAFISRWRVRERVTNPLSLEVALSTRNYSSLQKNSDLQLPFRYLDYRNCLVIRSSFLCDIYPRNRVMSQPEANVLRERGRRCLQPHFEWQFSKNAMGLEMQMKLLSFTYTGPALRRRSCRSICKTFATEVLKRTL